MRPSRKCPRPDVHVGEAAAAAGFAWLLDRWIPAPVEAE